MKNKIVSFVFACLLLFVNVSFSQHLMTEKLDEYLNASVTIKGFSGSVLVARKDTILLKKGYGYANLEHKIENKPETAFLLASVTKQFTATAIIQLASEGKIKLDDHITDHLPYYRKDIGEKVTIHQLLNHTSGIPGYTEIPYFFVNESKLSYTTQEFVKKFCMNDLEFEPGTDQKYNNSAYYILGAIIENISKMSYAGYIRENIFNKLGMYHSGYATHQKIIENKADGYSKANGELFNAQYLDIGAAFSAGGLYSTVEDLYLWDRSLYTSFLLPDKWRDTLFYDYKNGFGYGWINEKMFGHKVVHHNGGIHGFSTHISRFVDDDICIIILGNTDFVQASYINSDLASILFDLPYEIPRLRKSISVDESILQKYTGEYKGDNEMIFVVTVESQKIHIEVKGQPKMLFLAETETEFYLENYPISISFIKDKEGNVSEMILHQNGDHPLKKIK